MDSLQEAFIQPPPPTHTHTYTPPEPCEARFIMDARALFDVLPTHCNVNAWNSQDHF